MSDMPMARGRRYRGRSSSEKSAAPENMRVGVVVGWWVVSGVNGQGFGGQGGAVVPHLAWPAGRGRLPHSAC